MVSESRHTINRINATIQCGKNGLSKIQRRGLASDIENALESLSPFLDKKFGSSKPVRIESLSIELQIDTNELAQLGTLLKDSLLDVLTKVDQEKHALPQTVYREAKIRSPEEVFLYFLRNGKMPWFSAKLEWEKIDHQKGSFKTQLERLMKSSPEARERLVDQSSFEQLRQLLLLLLPSNYLKNLIAFTESISQNIPRFSTRYAAGFRIRQKVIENALKYFLNSSESKGFMNFLKYYWPTFVLETEKECNGKHLDFLRFLGAKANLNVEYELPLEKNPFSKPASQNDTISGERGDSTTEEVLESIFKEEKQDAQQMVNNAGIVLLHPFIKRFFTKVGLIENDEFISFEHQQRGICLLHYLATGETVFAEEKLLLMKHLCHYPSQRSVPKDLPISNFERTEANTVLEAAIRHWEALKRTSKEGLQINFLQRKGLLEKDVLGHALHVETRAADVLLDRLPWGLSTIHLPWLPHRFTVKWR